MQWAGPCTSPLCKVCTTRMNGPCRRLGCTYKLQCLACKEQGPDTVPEEEEQGGGRRGQGKVAVPCLSLYHGETSYSAYVQSLDHNKDEEHKRQTNAMVPPLQRGGVPDAYGLHPQGTSEQETQGGGGHCCRQPDPPPQLQGGASPRSSTQHKDSEGL